MEIKLKFQYMLRNASTLLSELSTVINRLTVLSLSLSLAAIILI